MELDELQRAIEAILFAAGERVEVSRLAMALETDEAEVAAAAAPLIAASVITTAILTPIERS